MNNYRLKKERERIAQSWAIVMGGTLFIFLISYIFNLFQFEDFTDYSGPVKITFGSPDSEISTEEMVPVKPLEKKIEEVVKEVAPVEPEIESPPITKEEIVNKTPEKKVLEPPKDIVKKSETKSEEVIKPTEPVIQKGRESGNSHETSFESSSSDIGRRAYFPITDYMPPPTILTSEIYASIKGDVTGFGEVGYNRRIIDRFYFKDGNNYQLIENVPFENRPDVWAIISNAGYDLNKAEYKQGKKLKSVIIVFEISKNTSGVNSIKSAEIDSSSGDKDIDAAVLYGFKQSTYSNATDKDVKGRFKYSFN
ncbi:MAG: hypothetical protein JXR64_09280 [Spirochaetales bacterium]|nr:hypothetical protein [Spirochaetales bacterium]